MRTLLLPILGKQIGLANTLALLAEISGLGLVITAVLRAGLSDLGGTAKVNKGN